MGEDVLLKERICVISWTPLNVFFVTVVSPEGEKEHVTSRCTDV